MPFSQAIFIEARHARIEATGEFNLDEAIAAFEHVVQAIAEHKLETVLYDARAVTGSIPDYDRFVYGTSVSSAAAVHAQSRTTLFAYVMNPPVRDPGRLGEMAATRGGMRVRTFEGIDVAMAWLRHGGRFDPW
jgi:hypothetical protein